MAHRVSVDLEIQRMLDLNIIQLSNSPYINPMVIVIKKDGSVRLCLDARKLNEYLIADHECMQTTEEIFQKCTCMKVVSSFDRTSSFWQIPLNPDSRKYTAFLHKGNCYEFVVIPFGLKTSSASLIRGLEIVLHGLGDHIEEVNFLGHVLTTEGIQPQKEKLQAIQDFPKPKNLKQLRGFLGLVNFYTKFTSRHAHETTSLLELLKKGTKWKCEKIHNEAFERVEQLFQEAVFANARLARWILSIQDYDLTVEHCAGKDNVVADTLSRQISGHEENALTDKIVIAHILAKEPAPSIGEYLKNIKKYQDAESGIKCIKQALLKEPQNHNKRHVGGRKVFRILREEFAHPKMEKHIKIITSRYDLCQQCKVSNQSCYAVMKNITPEKPLELVSIDYFRPLPPAKGGYKHILVSIDAFSKFVALYPLREANAAATIKCIFAHYIPNDGKPKRLQFDHGTQFTSKQWLKKLQREGIQPVFSSMRHPQENIVERVNRELGRFFRTLIWEKHQTWINWLQVIQDCINEVHHETTEFTPIEIHLNKKPSRFWKKWLKHEDNTAEPTYETKLKLVRETLEVKGKKRAEKFNQTHKLTNFTVGDKVL
ncbi:uncharacterized protein LOC111674111, partial [Orussus abietinus]|uniref:uncharacterized protein LOC111674111 n=1 Tax=Orussus abietinus TaxID=222816 RepID=UPI000C7161C4